ncbi:VOC family protein [Roseiarcus sp.]|uniref:VOC family protein n=1 Tax=Roseiarcus sp. TaxID=1969460 RepID=UPI003F97384C
MLDHIGIAVADFARSTAFYEAALKPLGLSVIMAVTAEETGADAHAGFGASGKPFFWIGTGARPKGGTHVCFAADTRAEVDAFYEAALAAGGRDNGAPGLRPRYHANYYGSFVLDPDGNNIEAVCHRPA